MCQSAGNQIVLFQISDIVATEQKYRTFLSSLTEKRPPDAPLALHHTPSLGGGVSQSVNEAIKEFPVIITFRKGSKNYPLLLAVLTYAVSTTAEEIMYSLGFLPGNCVNLASDVVTCVLSECILATGSCSFKARNTVVLNGRS